MIITSHMQKIIQIHPCLLLSCKQENVTDGRPLLLYTPPLSRGIKKGVLDSQAASDKVYQLLAHGRWFFGFFFHLNWCSWNIAESGVKHQKKPNV